MRRTPKTQKSIIDYTYLTTPPLNNVIRIDDERIKGHLDRVVRGTVEETLNALLDAEADRLCNAQRYERTDARRDTRAGHYERNLETKAGEVTLKVPKLRRQTFETAIIERYRRREASVEEALIEMYLAGVSVRRVEDITEALWARGFHHRRSATSTKRSMPPSRRGGIVRSRASTHTSISTAS
jgi:transposase-like protein